MLAFSILYFSYDQNLRVLFITCSWENPQFTRNSEICFHSEEKAPKILTDIFFFKQCLFGFFKFIFIFIFGCVGSSSLREGLPQLRQMGTTLHRSGQAPHHGGLSRCGAQAADAQAQQLWLTGLAAPRHVGSSQTRARTHIPRIGRQIPNHCATREAPYWHF